MVNEIITLEDVFLRLTTDPDETAKDTLQLKENLVVEEIEEEEKSGNDEDEDEDDDDDDKNDKGDNGKNDDDKKNGGNYKPMFR
jgi:hypothetical protein